MIGVAISSTLSAVRAIAAPCGQPGCNVAATLNYYSFLSAQAATFQASVNHSGLIYGGQAGHNWLLHNIAWTWDGVIGVEVDFQGKSDSHSSTYTSVTPAAAFPAFPLNSDGYVERAHRRSRHPSRPRRPFVGSEHPRLCDRRSRLCQRAVQYRHRPERDFAPVSRPYATAGQITQEVFGPTIGGGIEWKWTANWSVKAEYLYVDLGNLAYNTNALIQPVRRRRCGEFQRRECEPDVTSTTTSPAWASTTASGEPI